MQVLTLSTDALIAIRESLKLTPQSDTDDGWAEAWREVRDALAREVDKRIT